MAENKMLENYLYDWVETITPLTSSKTKTTISIFNYFCEENEHSYTGNKDNYSI